MCDPASLSLRAAVDRLSLRRPFTAGITLQIATRAPSPCGLDASALRAQVLDGSQVLWSSDGCPSAGAAGTGPAPGSGPGTTPSTATPGGSAAAPASGGPAAASGGSATASAGGSGLQNVIAVPSQATADQHYTWHGNTCSGQLAPGRYDVVGRLGVAEAFAGTVTVS